MIPVGPKLEGKYRGMEKTKINFDFKQLLKNETNPIKEYLKRD
jgi:hypothetical protein